ncbi:MULTISPECIES: YtfJ family protein [unclassified Agarivorans]|uniref:YtfJ family protein n=1 Tax=unclassified Agarivorans TaxID=2636026 RepID=UPI003D7F1843
MKYLILFFSLLPTWVMALNLSLGESLPNISIDKVGELQLVDEQISYSPWNTKQLAGKVRLVQAMAGRSSAKEINAAMIEAIKNANFAAQTYQTTTIVNLDDAIFGTSMFVQSKLKSNKKKFPHASFVLDKDGQLFDLLDIKPKSSAIILLDTQGKILFAKDGALNKQEIKQVIKLIYSHI